VSGGVDKREERVVTCLLLLLSRAEAIALLVKRHWTVVAQRVERKDRAIDRFLSVMQGRIQKSSITEIAFALRPRKLVPLLSRYDLANGFGTSHDGIQGTWVALRISFNTYVVLSRKPCGTYRHVNDKPISSTSLSCLSSIPWLGILFFYPAQHPSRQSLQ
jgi:hypothetical protein